MSRDSVRLGSRGESSPLAATVTDAGGSQIADATVLWASSDTSVVTVNATGLVTAVRFGAAEIIATSGPVGDSAAILVMPSA